MKVLRLILGDQLNHDHSWYTTVDPNVTYVMMEVRQETDYAIHHIQKVAAFFTAMRHFAEYLRGQNHNIIYLRLDDAENCQNLTGNLQRLINTLSIEYFEYQEPDEYRLDQQIRDFTAHLSIKNAIRSSEHFLTERLDVKKFFGPKKSYRLERFYRHMRVKHNILMEGDRPAGDRWNYDRENRVPFNHAVDVPEPLFFANDVRRITSLIRELKIQVIGKISPENLIWPTNRSQAEKLTDYFIEHALPYFGTFQDAMVADQWALFHSRLSFALNVKLLHPMWVIVRILDYWRDNFRKISLPQVEGFIRQILGWREYMRGFYWAEMPDFAQLNYFGHYNHLPDFYWTGETRMHCLRQAIGQSLEMAYAHHIQRLMLTGNFALLAGTNPDEVDRWYLGIYIDAVEWVEITNTRGMSQFADGGMIASKPYVSSAHYINRMSDYCQICAYDPKLRYGDKACPFNSLYWHFYHRNRRILGNNPRVGMVYRNWDRKSARERDKIIKQAEHYLKTIETL